MANSFSTHSYREKYALSRLDYNLRNMLVAEAICNVDRSDAKVIKNPYISTAGATVQALAGTYSVGNITVTDDDLTVTDEFIEGGHVHDWTAVLQNFEIMNSVIDEMSYNVAEKIDRFVLNNLCEDGTGAYTTPTGGFTTSANVKEIFANINAKVAGYADAYRGLYVVVENTDLTGIIEAGADSGYSFADATLNNGFVKNFMGVDIYVVRSGTFASETLGTTTYTNAGHRVAGVKGVSTFAHPRGVKYEEKGVSGKTGKELVVYGYIGFKQWATKAGLTIDITLA